MAIMAMSPMGILPMVLIRKGGTPVILMGKMPMLHYGAIRRHKPY